MAELPVDIIYDILSRMPVKSLDRFRCVCKEWCKHIGEPNFAIIIQMNRAIEEPIPIMSKMHHDPGPTLVTLFRITEDEAKKDSVLEFEWKKRPEYPIGGSCNGLLCLLRSSNFWEITFSVIHPLRNERYELPPIRALQSWGLGFDASTNTFKMCVSVFVFANKTIKTMVHVLGTDSWREIPQIPYYRRYGKAVFAHGCLHWLEYYNQVHPLIRFDVSKEEFRFIDYPTTGSWLIYMVKLD